MSTFGLSVVKINFLYLLLAILLFPLVGVLIALFPPTAVALVGLFGGVLLFILPIEAVMLIAIGLAPLSSLFIVKVGIFDFRFVQVLWLIVFARKVIQTLVENRSFRLPRTDIWKPMVLLALAALLSTIISKQPQISTKEFVQLIYLFILFFTIATSFNQINLLIKASSVLVIATLIVSIIGLVTIYLGVSAIPTIEVDLLNNVHVNMDFANITYSYTVEGFKVIRLQSVNLSSVATAAFLTQIILLVVSLFWFNDSNGFKINKIFYGIVLILSSYAWFLTNSRAAMVSLFILLFFAIVISGRRRNIGIIFVLVFLVVLIGAPSFSRLKDSFILEASTNPGHIALWYEAVKLFVRNSLFGIGIGMFPVIVTDYLWFQNIQTYTSGLNDVHNMFLKTAAEMGVLGLGALIWFFYIFLKDLWNSYQHSKGQTQSAIILGFFLAACAGVLMNLTANIFAKEYTWTIWGLAYAAALISTNIEPLPSASEQPNSRTAV